MITNWGYTLPDVDTLPDLLTAAEFESFTAGKYSSDSRIASEISAACAAIRNFCGWHISPSTSCSLTEHLLYGNGRVKIVGRDLMIQLPAKAVTEIESVTVGDTECEEYTCDTNGILHVFDVDLNALSRKTEVVVEYAAGFSDSDLLAVKELIAHRVTHALAVPAGITSEAAGGVSVTYNANWANNVRATALPDDNKEVLMPYRVQGVF